MLTYFVCRSISCQSIFTSVWDYKGKKYHNERTLATPRTGWNFIASMRPWMPPELSALVWFATDDSSTSPRIPVYGSNRQVAEPYAGKGTQDGVVAPLLQFDTNKAFWVQNMVSNFCYFRWQDAYPVVREKIDTVSGSSSLKYSGCLLALDKERPSPG